MENKLFIKSKYESLKFIFALALSLALMFSDFHYHCLNNIRILFSFLISPLQYTVDYPIRLFNSIQSMVSSKKSLIAENIQLHYKQTVLEAQLQKLLIIKQENSQLKELLLTASKANMQAMAAQILAVDLNSARQIIIINKGKRDGIYSGQPVLDAKGVMGQVIDVGYMTSTVLLISDAKCAVPVRNNRTGERAILVGNNSLNRLSLANLPKTSSVREGDILVTSGLGRLYPEGYPVGKVEAVRNIPGEPFSQINVSPIALLNRTQLVLLIWPDKDQKAIRAQIEERLSAMGANVEYS